LDALLVWIPPLDQMTLPRFAVLVPWGLTIVAAVALDGALRGRVRSLVTRLAPALVVAVVAASAAPWALDRTDLALVLTSLGMAVAGGLARQRRLLPLLVTVELSLLAVAVNPVADAGDRLPRPPLVEKLVELEAGGPCRVAGVGRAFHPNMASRYALRDLRASDPLRPAPFARLMGVLGEPATILGGALKRLPAGLCGAWGVGLAVTPPARDLPGWRREYADRDGMIWSNPRLLPEVRVVGRVYEEPEDSQALLEVVEVLDFETTALVGPDTAAVDADFVTLELWRRTPTVVEASVECDGPCLLIVAQPWAPGWKATMGGEGLPLVRTNVAGLGAVVPAGRHTVVLTYHPWSWPGGVP
jgi:hypothetical protein